MNLIIILLILAQIWQIILHHLTIDTFLIIGRKKQNKSIFLKPVTDNEILGLVKSFKNKYSCGYDGLNMYLIKQCIRQIVKPLTYICNLSVVIEGAG